MKRIVYILYVVLSLTLLLYVLLPNFDFPLPPPDSVQSQEPADMETPLRRAYFTNHSRSEILEWYKKQFKESKLFSIPMPTYLLNYPPEEAQGIIRDQTRSTYLQEIVNPFRETVFINGFEPRPDDDQNKIVINGVHWRQKIIVRYIPTNTLLRFVVMSLTLISVPVLINAFKPEVNFIKNELLLAIKKLKKRS